MTYYILFVGNLVFLALIMKVWAHKLVTTSRSVWPTPALLTLDVPRPPWANILLRQIFFFILLSLYLQFLRLDLFPLQNWWQRLAAVPLVWFTTEWLGATLLILFGRPRRTPLIHRAPWQAMSQNAFWGQHWNRWVSPWLALVSSALSQSRPGQLWWAFGLSGFFHELLFNVPYQLFTGRIFYGNMLAFFLLQGLFVLIDRTWLKSFSPTVRRTWLWASLLGTAPLFLETPVLYFFGLSS